MRNEQRLLEELRKAARKAKCTVKTCGHEECIKARNIMRDHHKAVLSGN